MSCIQYRTGQAPRITYLATAKRQVVGAGQDLMRALRSLRAAAIVLWLAATHSARALYHYRSVRAAWHTALNSPNAVGKPTPD